MTKRKGNYKPGPGRPKGRDYPHRHSVRVTQEQHEFLEAVATENDSSIADVIRMLIDRARPTGGHNNAP